MRILWAWLFTFLIACSAPGSAVDAAGDMSHDMGLVLMEEAESARTAALDPAWTTASPSRIVAPEQDAPAPATPRQVIYSAGLRLVVVSASDALNRIQALAETAGGYMQKSDSRSITIRVPADKFEESLTRIASLGELVDRSVEASDVTEQMLDLNIRLDNLRRTRERLLDHLAKSEKIETTLKIEAELTRVSGEIEQLEGKLRFLQSQIAMSTIRVELNVLSPAAPGSGGNPGLPFDWIERLGDGLVAGNVESLPRKPGFFARGPRFDPPKEFIRYYSSDDRVEAMSADGLRLKLQKQENYDKGALAFWSKLARKSLVESRALAIGTERDLGLDRALFSGTREVGGEQLGYLLVLARTRSHVYSFEAWGPMPAFEGQFDALVASAQSLRR